MNKIKLVAEFECAIQQNAVNIAVALAQAGRYVRIRGVYQSHTYTVEVWETEIMGKKNR